MSQSSHDSLQTLGAWAPQRQMTLEQARKRSRLVGSLRMAFVAGAAVSAGVMVGPMAATAISGASYQPERISASEVVTMVNPRFTGRNVAGEPFEITARTAQRRLDDASVIDLTDPRLEDQNGTIVTALEGVYHQNDEFLDLYKDVQVRDPEGYVFGTSAARVFVQEGRVRGLEPLDGAGPLGDVRADAYEIVDEGDRVILRGCVYMTIFPGGRDAPEYQSIEAVETDDGKDSCGRPGRDYDYTLSP